MARITGFTSERMLEIEATTIVDGEINAGGNLILSRRDGFTIDAGPVAGPKGDHGAGVYDVDIYYQAGTSGTEQPTGEWSTNVPVVHPGDYLWIKTTTTYADPENIEVSFTTDTFTVVRQPEQGTDGRGIRSQTVEYLQGVSGVTAPSGNWLGAPPFVEPGLYLWTRTTTTYTTGDPQVAYSVAKQGKDGTPGETGADGKTQYLHVAYASTDDGVGGFSTTDPSGKSYMGTCTNFIEADPTDPAVYKWQLIRGSNGVGISSSNVRYQSSTSGTVSPTGDWSDYVPDVAEGDYLWSRSIVNFTDGASQTTYSVSKQGVRGNDGSDGRGITSIIEEYYLSNSSTTVIGGEWSDTRQPWQADKYFWTRSTINFTSGNPTTTTPICVSGESGSDGADGRSINDVDVYYYLSTSSLILAGGTWNTVAPDWVDGQYMWTKTVTTYSVGATSESSPVCITGSSGKKGDDGKGITETVVMYAASGIGTSAPTSGWSLDIPEVDPGNFLWTRTVTSYTDGPDTTSYSVGMIGEAGPSGKDSYTWIKYADAQNGSGMSGTSLGKTYIGIAHNKPTMNASDDPTDYTWSLIKGADGADGRSVSSVDVQYYLSTSDTTQTGSIWVTNPPEWTDGRFMWTKTVVTYSTGDPTETLPVNITGSKGLSGRGVNSIVEEYYLSYSDTTQSGGEWVTEPPAWVDGRYYWTRSRITYSDSSVHTTIPINTTGASGESSVLLRIDSSHGTTFKNTGISTQLTVTIFHGETMITTKAAMQATFGESSYLEWWIRGKSDTNFTALPLTDARITMGGFTMNVSPSDVFEKAVFQCVLNT